jgi:microsomal epoxide hydrolase
MVLRPQPFTLHVPDDDLTDLKARLARTRLPDQAPGAPWAYGTDLTYLRSLIEYWRTGLIGVHEARLNAFPRFGPCIGSVHYLHARERPDPKPSCHAWRPSSVFEFMELIHD